MRTYQDCYELISEISREVLEMGIRVHPNSMQNKIVAGDERFSTLEITNYSYCLLSREREGALFIGDPRSLAWVRGEFKERINREQPNPGEAYKIRNDVWEQFLNEEGRFDYAYSERINRFDNLTTVIRQAKVNPDSRQLILPIFEPYDLNYIAGHRRIPCSIYYQFLIRNGKIDIVYSQRSADIYTHFGNDVWLAWELMEYVAKEVGVKPGYLYHNIGSLHVYNKDIQNLRTCLAERI